MDSNQQELLEIKQPAVQMQITQEAVSYLLTTAKWAKFLAIIGFIVTGFLMLAGLVIAVFFGTYSRELGSTGMMAYFSSGSIGIVYIIMAFIHILPVLYLNNFSNGATRAVRSGSTERLTYSLRNLKRFFKFTGLLLIVLLVIYLIVIVFALGAGIYLLGN